MAHRTTEISRSAPLSQHPASCNLPGMIKDSGVGKCLTNGYPRGGRSVLICAFAYSHGVNIPSIVLRSQCKVPESCWKAMCTISSLVRVGQLSWKRTLTAVWCACMDGCADRNGFLMPVSFHVTNCAFLFLQCLTKFWAQNL